LILDFSDAQAGCGFRGIHVVLVLVRSDRQHAVQTTARPDAHERSARGGSNAGEVQGGVHDGSWVKKLPLSAVKGWTKGTAWAAN